MRSPPALARLLRGGSRATVVKVSLFDLMPVPAPTQSEDRFLFEPRLPCTRALCAALWIFGSAAGLWINPAFAQNLLPNPGFQEGHEAPTGWRLVGASGHRIAGAPEGGSALLVEGNGNDQGFWRTEAVALQPGALYRLSVSARRDQAAAGGAAIAGLSRVNLDLVASNSWQRSKFVFSVPMDDTN